MKNMSCLKFKQILLYVKTLRVTPNDNLKNHEFEMNDKIKVTHELHKREDGDIITLTYKKTILLNLTYISEIIKNRTLFVLKCSRG